MESQLHDVRAMRPLLAILTTFVFAAPQGVCADIRHVDFRNFTYLWAEAQEWSRHPEWLNPNHESEVTLKDGQWEMPDDDDDANAGEKRPLFAGLTLEEVKYGRLTGDPREAAIVVLRFDSGGTQYSYYVYVYVFQRNRPQLLAAFHAGDRSYFGLSRAYPSRGRLVVELFDPEHRIGDCCSDGLVRITFRWHHGKFEEAGARQFLKADSPTRLAVSIFGIHQ